MKIETIISDRDQLKLEVAILECESPKGIVQISHGMSEHKERYYPFMEYLKKITLSLSFMIIEDMEIV